MDYRVHGILQYSGHIRERKDWNILARNEAMTSGVFVVSLVIKNTIWDHHPRSSFGRLSKKDGRQEKIGNLRTQSKWTVFLRYHFILKCFPLFSSGSSVAQSCLTLCNPMDCSTPGFPVLQQLPKPAQAHVSWVGDAIQPSHPLSSPSPPAFNLSQHQMSLFKWISSSHQVAKVLEFQLQHQSFQWIFRTDFL